MMKLIKRYPLPSFFALAFLITWSLQLAAIALAADRAMTLSNETNFTAFVDLLLLRLPSERLLVYLLFALGAGPLIAAIVVTAADEGRAGLRDLWRRSTKWRLAPRWYAAALGIPLLLSLVSAGLGWLADGKLDYQFKLPLTQFLPFLLYMIVFTGIAEEPGWRGFALPRLQSRYSAEQSSWILGLLWGVWHYPFIIYYNLDQGVGPLIGSLVGLTLGIVGWTIVNNWLYNCTASVWLIILLHGWGNTVQSYLVLSSQSYVAQSLYGVLPWAIAALLLRIYGKENLAPHQRPQKPVPSTGSAPAQQR